MWGCWTIKTNPSLMTTEKKRKKWIQKKEMFMFVLGLCCLFVFILFVYVCLFMFVYVMFVFYSFMFFFLSFFYFWHSSNFPLVFLQTQQHLWNVNWCNSLSCIFKIAFEVNATISEPLEEKKNLCLFVYVCLFFFVSNDYGFVFLFWLISSLLSTHKSQTLLWNGSKKQ